MTEGHYRRTFVVILIIGFALRLAWALVVPVQPISDSSAYDELAWNLAFTGRYAWNNGTLTAYWPVGTSFIYSLPFRLFGHHYGVPVALNLAAGTTILALVMAVARRWLSPLAALVAGALYALWPSQIEFTTILASELHFQLAVLLAMWAAFAPWPRSWLLKGAITGLCLAAASYIRPLAIPLVILLPAALIWSRRVTARELGAFTATAAIVMALCIAPWTLRNERVLGAPVLISTNGPPVMWMGNNPDATGAYIPLPHEVDGMSEVERSKVLGSRARRFIIGHPGQFAILFLRKLAVTHERETIGVVWNQEALESRIGSTGTLAAKALSTAYWLAMLVLALGGVGLVLARERWRGLIHPALLLWGYFAVLHAITLGADRYHFPSIPYIAMLAAVAVIFLLGRFRLWPGLSDAETPAARARTTAG